MKTALPSKRNIFFHAAALSTLACGACSGAPQDPATPAATATAVSTAAPVATVAPTASATATAAAVTPPPAPESKLIAVASLPGAATPFAVEGALLLARDEAGEISPEGKWGVQIGVVDGDRVTFGADMVLDGMHRVISITGTWPGAVDILATGDTGRTGIAEHYVRGAKGLSASSARVGQFFVGVGKTGGSVLAMSTPMFPFSELPAIKTVRGPALSYKPQAADKKCEQQKAAVFPSAFGTAGDGAVLAYGNTCDDKPAVEMWAAAGKPSTIVALPGTDVDREARILTGSGKEAWLLAGQVMRFDGAAWTKLDPPPGYVNEGAVAPDGTLWILTASGTVAAWRGGEWQHELLPDGAAANHIAIDRDGTLWVTTATSLLRTRRPADAAGAGVALGAKDKAPPAKKKRLSPGSKSCTQNVVVLYGFTKVTPDDYDFPLTRKAVKGHKEYSKTRFVVTRDAGQKYFTALVPDYDTGKRLVQLVEKEVQGSKPQLVCAEPEIVREVKIDLATGDVIK